MVYIYKKPIGNGNYYYLRASERKKGKILAKDIAYLGSSIEEVKSNLEKLPKLKDQIRKSYKKIHSFLESNHFLEKAQALKLKQDSFLKGKTEEVEACRLHYYDVFNRLDGLTKKDAFKTYVIEFAYNTASIEGNTINLDEARDLLNEGITPKGKTLREIYDLQNTEKVFFELLSSPNKEITHELIISIHDKLLENIDERRGYRTTDILVMRSNFDATPGKYVKTDMDLLLKWYYGHKNKLRPLVLASVFHHKFEKIHPFMDGNGRTGRMIMNYILIKSNWPPTIIHKKNRNEYLDAMREADLSDTWKLDGKHYASLISYGTDEFIDTYWSIFL
ncbi:Fic family protein [Candidatus Pacearchaeota archaeon]|nr:Fic family protein [Candidatus Pacearchaeota archaeon]